MSLRRLLIFLSISAIPLLAQSGSSGGVRASGGIAGRCAQFTSATVITSAAGACGSGGGGLTGTLTAGKIPVATAATVLGDGSFSDNGSGVVSSGTLPGLGFAYNDSSAANKGQSISSVGTIVTAPEGTGVTGFPGYAIQAIQLELNPSADSVTTGWYGLQINSETLSTGTHSIGNDLGGAIINAAHKGSGNVFDMGGINTTSILYSAGNITDANQGLVASGYNFGAGTIGLNQAGDFGSGGTSGTITDDHTVSIDPPLTGATFTNTHVGLYIDDQKISGVGQAIKVVGGTNDLGPQLTTVSTLTATGTVTAPTYATTAANGGITGIEGTGAGLTAAAGTDLLYPDSTSHCWHANLNNSDAGCLFSSLNKPTLNQVLSPTANVSFTAPATDTYSFLGTAPVSVSGAGTAAGTHLTVTAPDGGATTGSATTGGAGGDINITSGNGGSGAGGTNANGGRAGNITFALGAGGAKQGSGVAGAAGQIIVPVGGASTQSTGFPSLTFLGNLQTGFGIVTQNLVATAPNGFYMTQPGVSTGYFAMSGHGFQIGSGDIYGFSSGTAPATNGSDTAITRGAAGVLDIGTGAAASTAGKLKASGYMSVGTKFTTNNGCTDSATAGGATAGTFTVGSTSCTEIVTMGDTATAPNGWSCTVVDITTLADVTNPHQTTSNATTATFVTGTVVSGDKIQFSCIGY